MNPLSSELSTQLKTFFETSPLARDAAQSLRDGRQIEIQLLNSGEKFTFEKIKGAPRFTNSPAAKADITFKIPDSVAQELATKAFPSVGQVGLFLFDSITSSDIAKKTQVSLHCGALSLVTGGYFGILTSGGAEVAKYLATKGLGNLGKIKDAIARMRQS